MKMNGREQLTIMVVMMAAGALARPPSGGTHGGDGKPPEGAGFVERLDRDRDGKVSRNEFDGPAEHFSDFDKNGDGYINEKEAPKGPPPQNGGGDERRPPHGQGGGQMSQKDSFVGRLDKDGDGQVSKSEFDGPAEAFKHLDKNKDGNISENEAPTGPPPHHNGLEP